MSGQPSSSWSDTDIAIVGMAGRFPGARTVDEFWANLRSGVESVTWLTDEQLAAAGVDPAVYRSPDYVRAAYPLPDMEMFDASFFGFSPRDASIMDPQHRHFLECAWGAIEHAGHTPESLGGSVGVFAGCGASTYLMFNLLTNPRLVQSVGFFLLRHTGNDKDFLATRTSYELNLGGPSVNVQTACSTSLVAVHLACQSLLNGECDTALAGGATVRQPHLTGYLYKEGEIMSPDGHCRAFDADSQGTVFGSGVGVVVLRRLADAIAAGDRVHAVIKGSAVNNDGSQKVGFLAPSVDGQARAIAEALAVADVEPASIDYVEAHGTGTPVGDPIEIAALTHAFHAGPSERGSCRIGSLKTNVGHLDTAAGVAGLIKTVLALEHREIPPSLNYHAPNLAIDFADGPFTVNTSLAEWTRRETPRRAGVSSLGAGGTNAHVVLEEAPETAPSGPSREWQLMVASGKTPGAARAAASGLARHLREAPDQPLADVAYTLRVGRRAFAHRRFAVGRSAADAAAALEAAAADEGPAIAEAGESRSVAFMFAGGGAQHPGMGAELYQTEPVYRDAVDRCLDLLESRHDVHLRPALYPGDADAVDAALLLERPSLALPALFVTQYALAMLWKSWGVQPAALIGHSMGEYTAAHLAGVFSLEDALALVTLRGRLFERVPAGGMLSVPLPADELRTMLGDALSIAAVNAPELCVASGPTHAIEALERELAAREIEGRRVRISIAAHSAMVDPILPEFEAFLRGVTLRPPTIPLVSNVSGTWLTPAQATDPEYWVRHLRGTVHFAAGVGTLLEQPDRVLLEVGPGRTLSTLASLHPSKGKGHAALPSMRHPDARESDVAFLLGVLGRLWQGGAAVDWNGFHGSERRLRVPLPTYPFEHQRFWIEPGKAVAEEMPETGTPRKRPEISSWFYQPSWKRTRLDTARTVTGAAIRASRALVFTDPDGIGVRLAERLSSAGCDVVRVMPGERFARAAGGWSIRVGEPTDHVALLEALAADGGIPTTIVHLWNVGRHGTAAGPGSECSVRDRSFFSLLYLAQALGGEEPTDRVDLVIVSDGVQHVAGERHLDPEKALLVGPCRVIGRENPGIRCRSVDVEVPRPGSRLEERLLEQLLAEIDAESDDEIIAYRAADRWVQTFEPMPLPPVADSQLRIREGGVYLVTGGLGGIGSLIARELARIARVRLVLVGRTPLPPRDSWDRWLQGRGNGQRVAASIRLVRELEAGGSEVAVFAGDVTDAGAMAAVVRETRERFGAIDGVVHAAGVLDDGLIGLKERDTAARVLAPKVEGTLALDAALGGSPLDFFLLCSSRGAISGVAGQVDYTAASAFLDAFAHRKALEDGTPTVSIDWSAWEGVGMTASASAPAPVDALRFDDGRSAAHPLLDRCLVERPEQSVYATRFGVDSHWVLGEHRMSGGEALLPGTGYLEMVRAAFEEQAGDGAVELNDVFFVAPFTVHPAEHRELRVQLRPSPDGTEFVVLGESGAATGRATDWSEHARGTIGRVDPEPAPRHRLDELLARCGEREQTFTGSEARLEHLQLGPRWSNVRSIRFGRAEAIATLACPPAFVEELSVYQLHPALLDVATACAQALIPGYDRHADFYVPVSYGRLLTRGSLPAAVYSHIRYRPAEDGGKETAVFDITILDEQGVELVSVTDFTMFRVADRSTIDAGRRPEDAADRQRRSSEVVRDSADRAAATIEGIAPAEGVDAFRRLLAHSLPPQVVVSPHDLREWIAYVRRPSVSAAAAVEPEDDPEMREVEAALASHESVRQAVVMSRRDGPGRRRLVAYVVRVEDGQATVSELRRHLKERLSEDLVPQHIVELDALPVDRRGRVDRCALPDPFAAEDDHVSPRTDTERAIAEVWRDLLGTDRVSVHDNFLDVGGHSLLAMRAIARIAKRTGVRLSPSALNLQTLEQLAAECDRRTPAPAVADVRLVTTPATASGEDAVAADAVAAPAGLTQRLFDAVRQTVTRT